MERFASQIASKARSALIPRRLPFNVTDPQHDSIGGFREAWTTQIYPNVPLPINAHGHWTLGASWKCVAVRGEPAVGLSSIGIYTTSTRLVAPGYMQANLARYDYENAELGLGRKRHIHALQPLLGTKVHYLIPDGLDEPWDLKAVIDVYLSTGFVTDLRDAGLQS